MTLLNYLKNPDPTKSSTWVAIASLLSSPPLLAYAVPEKLSAVLLPPVGNYKTIASAIYITAVVVAVVAGYLKLGWLRTEQARTRVIVAAAAALASYVVLLVACVRTEYVPAAEKSFSVVIGFVRSAKANTAYPGATASQILEGEGPYDSTVDEMWSENSVIAARSLAILLYAAVGGTLAILTGAAIAKDGEHEARKLVVSQKPPHPN